MLMVIFGAGASYDAIPSHPAGVIPDREERLPLAKDLFADRFMQWTDDFPECKFIIPRLQRVPNVESELERLQTEAEAYPPGLRQLAALRFYLQCMIYNTEKSWTKTGREITNYKTLLDDIKRARGASETTILVTFNYDLMIEHALRSIDVQINDISDYVKDSTFKLIKLHGSVDWCRQVLEPAINTRGVDQLGAAQRVVENAVHLKLGPYHRIVGSPPHGFIDYQVGGTPGVSAAYPALAIPVETKKDFECPGEHLAALLNFIPKVTKILVIGWRGAEVPFRHLLLKHLRTRPRIMVVDPEASVIVTKLAHIEADFYPIESGFTDFIVSRIEGDRFLRD